MEQRSAGIDFYLGFIALFIAGLIVYALLSYWSRKYDIRRARREVHQNIEKRQGQFR